MEKIVSANEKITVKKCKQLKKLYKMCKDPKANQVGISWKCVEIRSLFRVHLFFLYWFAIVLCLSFASKFGLWLALHLTYLTVNGCALRCKLNL